MKMKTYAVTFDVAVMCFLNGKPYIDEEGFESMSRKIDNLILELGKHHAVIVNRCYVEPTSFIEVESREIQPQEQGEQV